MTKHLFEVEDLDVSYGPITAVRGASLHVDTGEIVTVIGPNGAGKTTLLRGIVGLEKAGGKVTLAGRDITREPAERRIASGLALVPQGRRVFAESTVEMNLWAGAFMRRDKSAVDADIEKWLEYFPALSQRRHLHAGMLSGGEQQMLAVARALMQPAQGAIARRAVNGSRSDRGRPDLSDPGRHVGGGNNHAPGRAERRTGA